MTKTILILGISTVLASIACSSETTGSGDSNLTGDSKKKSDTSDTKPAPSSSSKTNPGPAPSSTSPPSSSSSPVAACIGQCLATNAKAKKLNDDDRACMAKCPADPGGPSTDSSATTSASGGGSNGSEKEVSAADSAAMACWDGCDKAFDDACRADQATCDAIFACEDKCAPPGTGTESSGGDAPSDGTSAKDD